MSNVNVYTARETLPIDEILEGIRARGIDAEWKEDEAFSADEPQWDAGSLTASDGSRVELSVQRIFSGEQQDLASRAPELSAEAGRLAGTLVNSYRVRSDTPSRLSWAVVDTIATLTPSIVLDADSNRLYDRAGFRARSPGAPAE